MSINDTPQGSNFSSGSKPFSISRNLIIAVGVVVALAISLLWWFTTKQGVISEGNKKQATLSAVYADGANYLANCVTKTKQTANVAQASADAFDKVVRDAIAGNGQAGQFNLDSPNGRAGLMPLLVQAWPDFKNNTALYEKVLNVIVGCQDDFRGKQSDVLDTVRQFNSWRTGSWKVRTFGGDFPTDDLVINIAGSPVVTGKAALLQMSRPIVNSQTSEAYRDGTYDADNPFATPSPSTTP